MTFSVHIRIMPLKDLLDPQGKAVLGGLHQLGLKQVSDVRIGKQVEMKIEADTKEAAHELASSAAKQLLANQVMEYFEVTVMD